MVLWRTGVLVSVVALAAGCVLGQSAGPSRGEFDDIPMPSAMTYLVDKAVIIELPGVKAARLLYRGRVTVTTLGPALRTSLESNGWRTVSSTTSGPQGTVQIYEKERSSLQIRVWEDFFYTYAEVTTSRLGSPPVSAAPAAAPAIAPASVPVADRLTDK